MNRLHIPNLLFVLLVVTVASASASHGGRMHGAHGSPMGPMGGPMLFDGGHIAAALDLTEEQRVAFAELREEMATQAAPLRELLHERQEQLHLLLESGDAEAIEVGQIVIDSHSMRQQLGALHEELVEELRGLLDADQLAKLQELEERRHHGRGFRALRLRHPRD